MYLGAQSNLGDIGSLRITIFIALFHIKLFLFRSTGLKELRLLIMLLVLFAASFQSKHLRFSCAQATEVDLGDHKPVFSNKCTTINFDFFLPTQK